VRKASFYAAQRPKEQQLTSNEAIGSAFFLRANGKKGGLEEKKRKKKNAKMRASR